MGLKRTAENLDKTFGAFAGWVTDARAAADTMAPGHGPVKPNIGLGRPRECEHIAGEPYAVGHRPAAARRGAIISGEERDRR